MYAKLGQVWTHLPDGIQIVGDLIVISTLMLVVRLWFGLGS